MLDHLRERRTAIIVMAVLTLLTMTLDLRGNALIDRARSVATDVFAPIKAVGDSASRPVVNAWHGAFEYDDLRRENAQLREQARGNESLAIEAQAAIEEYLRLRDQVGLPNIGNATPVRADVIGGPISNFEQGSMEINVGANAGVKTGMAVITSAGLVGRISQVTETRAKVRLIWDPTVSVSVKILGLRAPPPTTTTAPNALSVAPAVAATTTTTLPPTTTSVPSEEGDEGQAPPTSLEPTTTTTTLLPTQLDTGLLRGYGRGRVLGVDLIDEKAEVQIGDMVVTSGEAATNLPSLFPRDLPVGRVVEVKRVSGTTQLFVRVEPLADLEDIQTVTVVLYDPVG